MSKVLSVSRIDTIEIFVTLWLETFTCLMQSVACVRTFDHLSAFFLFYMDRTSLEAILPLAVLVQLCVLFCTVLHVCAEDMIWRLMINHKKELTFGIESKVAGLEKSNTAYVNNDLLCFIGHTRLYSDCNSYFSLLIITFFCFHAIALLSPDKNIVANVHVFFDISKCSWVMVFCVSPISEG